MKKNVTFKSKLGRVLRHWKNEQYAIALAEIEEMRTLWPGNAQVQILWANLVQLQETASHSLDDAKKALQEAIDLEGDAPSASIELGYFLDAVEDNPAEAAKAFGQATRLARRLLIDGLLGQAHALLQLGEKDEALQCVIESMYLANTEDAIETPTFAEASPAMILRDFAGRMHMLQVKGHYAVKVEDLLASLFPKRSA